MESTTHCPLFYSRYDLTWGMKITDPKFSHASHGECKSLTLLLPFLFLGPRRERIAPPPYQKLIFEVTITDWNIEPEGLFGFQSYVVYRISTVVSSSNLTTL